MTWEELVEKAKQLEYKRYYDDDKETEYLFKSGGKFYFEETGSVFFEETEIASNRTVYDMFSIMLALED